MSVACDAILREDTTDFGRMAIPLLHFRSAHPSALTVYNPLKAEDIPLPVSWRDWLAALRDRLGATVSVAGAARDEAIDVLFVSHVTSVPQAKGLRPDLYVGDLPQHLAAKGYRCAVAYIDQTRCGIGLQDWAGEIEHTGIARILLRRRLDWQSECGIADMLRGAARRLEMGTTHRPLRRLAAWQAGTGATRQVLRIAQQIGKMTEQLEPAALVFTYEGHGWERLAMAMARRHAPAIRCIAMHHAILAPLQHAMTRQYGPVFDPDAILAAGKVAFDWLRSVPGLAERPMDILGSPKALDRRESAPLGGRGSTCIFLPEGFVEESAVLSRAALAVARARPDLTCRVRLHPLIRNDVLMAQASDLAEAPANFGWSPPDRPLSADTSAARWAVYRGSSAIVSAMADGVEPIYLGDEAPALRIDPLRGAGMFRKTAASVSELLDLLAVRLFDPVSQAEAISYAHDYYRPLNPDVLRRFLPPPRARRSTEPVDDA